MTELDTKKALRTMFDKASGYLFELSLELRLYLALTQNLTATRSRGNLKLKQSSLFGIH